MTHSEANQYQPQRWPTTQGELTSIQRTHRPRTTRTIGRRLTSSANPTELDTLQLTSIIGRNTCATNIPRPPTALKMPTSTDVLALTWAGGNAPTADAFRAGITGVPATSTVLLVGFDVDAFVVAALQALLAAV